MPSYAEAITVGIRDAFQNEDLADLGYIESEVVETATADFARMTESEVYENGCADADGLYEWAYSQAVS